MLFDAIYMKFKTVLLIDDTYTCSKNVMVNIKFRVMVSRRGKVE
jgi:hypothetical protein